MYHYLRTASGLTFSLLWLLVVFDKGVPDLAAKKHGAKVAKVHNSQTAVQIIPDNKVPAILAQQNHKVVVANFWATWCVPCREEFPELVKLYHKYQKQGLVVLTFSIDDEDALEQVKKFLKEQKADFPAYLVQINDQEKFIDTIDKDWPGSIPTTFIYDQKGKMTKRLIGAHELAEFEKEIKPVLNRR